MDQLLPENSRVLGDGKGKRHNKGKIRYDLVPTFSQEQYAKVLTMGAEKYGPWNWARGMNWSSIISSMERHIQAIKKGEDYDNESGLLHSAHVMCNAAFLTEYYKLYPQGDDRNHWYSFHPKIGIDIDEVLANFISHYNTKFNIDIVPYNWNYDFNMKERLSSLKDDYDFWINIPPLIKASDLPFEPHCYITARPCKSEWTIEWLTKHGFPTKPVYTTEGLSKVEVAKKAEINWFIDDHFDNFTALNNAGICCFLWDAPHNRKYDVGFRRIKSFSDLPLFNQKNK